MPLRDFKRLISPEAFSDIESLAKKARQITKQRFGNTIQLYAPLYLGNICYNQCVYCGYNIKNKHKRVILNKSEILREGLILKEKGFNHILLLTGDAPKETSVSYIKKAIKILKPHFASISLEIYPLETAEYKELIQAGADSLTIYQETYHRPTYENMHLSGKKRDYDYRFDTPERAGKAGFYRINLGVLLGLYDWRYEALKLANHVDYLQKKYWQTKFSISIPRIQDMGQAFKSPHPVSDSDLVQLICAFRLVFPDLGITLSTREPAELRDHLLKLGITTISAESSTAPGGYTNKNNSEQFKVSDYRSLTEIKKLLQNNDFEPVMKDWD
ncbi:2-iminoacetate synthase ThiH [Candidatus Margulisiibacteriota bacterium]